MLRLASAAAVRVSSAVADAVLPHSCAACEMPLPGRAGPLCRVCLEAMEHLAATPYCPRCGRTMRPESIHDDGCAACASERHWNIGGVIRIGPYLPPLMELVRGVKFAGSERDARVLGELMAARLREAAWFPALDAFVPVPMHWLRRLQRPCAHAEVLAEAISRALLHSDGRRIPVLRAARRVRYAPSQLHIAVRAQRFENVVGCFAAGAGRGAWSPSDRDRLEAGGAAEFVRRAIARLTRWWGGSVAGKTVCIVDNMLVTGATVHEVSKALRAAGARKIYLAIAARSAAAGDMQADPAAFTRDGKPRM